ncbi:MAG: hypothetical protein R3253_00850 [Longimicrobiales bacterium]|nr:hypothetical protein [Longimicrobiales bacterium]
MRFAYIDSNGNEVPIPSVDALALRIELGAITENTQLYDAQADEWGPAHTHEIFHTLSRDAGGEEGFVAPPPVAPPPVAPPSPPSTTPPAPPEETPPPEATAEESSAEPPSEEEPDDGSFGLTLAPAEEESQDDPAAGGLTLAEEDDTAPEVADDALPDTGSLDLAPAAPTDEEPMDLAPSSEAPDGEGAVFDFGGMEDGLELEESFDAPDEEPMDLAPPGGGGGMELETTMEFDTGGFDAGDDSSLDLETPMSEFSPEEPPSWMEEDEDVSGDDVLDFSSVSATADTAGEGDVPLRERRTPRNKPSPPKHRKQRNLAPAIVAVVLLLAVGIGGYVAWPLVSDRLASSGEPDVPAVVLPPLSEDLMPVMRQASADALAAVFEEARRAWAGSSPVQEPPADWLEGIYLANASDYPTAQDFWSGMADFIDRVRGIDLATFDAALAAQLQSRGLSQEQATAVRERADSGFVAAAPDRAAVYDRFEELIDASLALHNFLVANEAQIEYAPAAAVITDPVLEVDPATEEIREAMEGLLDEVLASLNALQALGSPEGVTAEGLRAALRTRIQEEGVR